MPQGKPRSGEKYLHFKNKLYQIVTVAKHSETGEELVIYQALYGDFCIYARPFSMFISEVDHEKYPQVPQKYRFMLVEQYQSEDISEPFVETAMEESVSGEPESGKVYENTMSKEEKRHEDTMPESEKEQNSRNSSGYIGNKKDVTDLLMDFYDAGSYGEKYKILTAMREGITDTMINNMAVVLDVVISEGPLEKRYEELKRCLRTYEKYEIFR